MQTGKLIDCTVPNELGALAPRFDNPYISSKKNRQMIFTLWDRFNSNLLKEESISSPYELMIFKEWDRCRNLNVAVNMNRGVMLKADQFNIIRQRQHGLVEKALPVLKNVSHFLTGIPIILILTDPEGNVLQVLGDDSVRSQAAEYNIVEGSTWREELAGNNGLGTAIHRKTPVHVFAAEHYCEGWHSWTCAASPILNPFTNELIGLVDLTSLEKDYREEALGLSFSLANQIATELKMELEIKRIQLINKFVEYSTRYPDDGILVVDRSGQIIRISNNIKDLFPDTKIDDELLHKYNLHFERESAKWDEENEIGRVYTVRLKKRGTPKDPHVMSEPKVYGDFITLNTQMIKTLENIRRISSTDMSVLVSGESGTGKELVARYIHQQSCRKEKPFVAVNCGAISKELFGSKFFGYEKGAFTGADPQGRRGFFETAHKGTLFLDEIGELPLDIQASLLRVLETKKFRKLGSDRETEADFRIIAATNRRLDQEIQAGRFRSDLYYRLNVVKFDLIPLRDRPEDIDYLTKHFIDCACQKHTLKKKTITPEVLDILKKCEWKGNARELKNFIETMVFFSGDEISAADIPPDFRQSPGSTPGCMEDTYNLRSNEKQIIIEALKKYKKIYLVAKELGISRSTLYQKFDKLGIDYGQIIK